MADIDLDPEVRSDLGELESMAESIKKKAEKCQIDDIFLDDIGNIGGLHRKYTRFSPLPRSESLKRFNAAIIKARDAKLQFMKNCICYKK